jgi:hypothetical protein
MMPAVDIRKFGYHKRSWTKTRIQNMGNEAKNNGWKEINGCEFTSP